MALFSIVWYVGSTSTSGGLGRSIFVHLGRPAATDEFSLCCISPSVGTFTGCNSRM